MCCGALAATLATVGAILARMTPGRMCHHQEKDSHKEEEQKKMMMFVCVTLCQFLYFTKKSTFSPMGLLTPNKGSVLGPMGLLTPHKGSVFSPMGLLTPQN